MMCFSMFCDEQTNFITKGTTFKGAFTLGVKDSSIKSPNTKLGSHLGPKPIYHEDFMLTFI